MSERLYTQGGIYRVSERLSGGMLGVQQGVGREACWVYPGRLERPLGTLIVYPGD